MPSKRQKKEDAKRRISEAVPTLPIPRFAPAPLRALNLISRGAELGGQALVELDPLNIFTESGPAQDFSNPQSRAFGDAVMMSMVNDPQFKLSRDQVDLINNDDRMLVTDGNGMVEVNGRDVIRRSGQFRRGMLLPRTNQKRGRKKTKTDKTMSKALAQANKELRKKNGQLRAGVTQADIMRRAHRLRRKMAGFLLNAIDN